MAYCSQCGASLEADDRFCPACGARVAANRSSAQNYTVYDAAKEKGEAAEAGRQALRSLYAARDELNRARNWGIADILGGGIIVSMVKRSKMENAQGFIEQAKADLETFRRELSDVVGLSGMQIDTGDFMSFADWFFDGFFVDFYVQSQINQARDQVDEAIRRVEYVLQQLT